MFAIEPFIAYLIHALADTPGVDAPQGATAPIRNAASGASSLELLIEVVRSLPEDDQRLQALGSLAIRDGQFSPGAATTHAIRTFVGGSREACDKFLDSLVRVARDDALIRARSEGYLPSSPHR